MPAFCTSILGAMTDKTYPELGIIVCKGLALLIHSNQLALREPQAEEEAEKDEEYGKPVLILNEARMREAAAISERENWSVEEAYTVLLVRVA